MKIIFELEIKNKEGLSQVLKMLQAIQNTQTTTQVSQPQTSQPTQTQPARRTSSQAQRATRTTARKSSSVKEQCEKLLNQMIEKYGDVVYDYLAEKDAEYREGLTDRQYRRIMAILRKADRDGDIEAFANLSEKLE